MKKETKYAIMVILAAITIFGLVTGRYLFLVFILPLGGLFSKKSAQKEDES